MPIPISYMGTKRELAPIVADVVSKCRNGPLLDLFSGICAVGNEITNRRGVWANDAQSFCATVSAAYFTSTENVITVEKSIDLVYPYYEKNFSELSKRFSSLVDSEETVLQQPLGKIISFNDSLISWSSENASGMQRRWLKSKPNTFPYRLFALMYAGTYLGLIQCIQIDSIRFAVDRLFQNKLISLEDQRWLILALCVAMCKCSTTTGHFAQYLKPKENNSNRFYRSRAKSVWREFIDALYVLEPVGSRKWRNGNRTFNMDANALLVSLKNYEQKPAVVYADPPYTKDQYSRYYHLYETLLHYDYPKVLGVARYRCNRFISEFSTKSSVETAFVGLVEGVSSLGSELVVSYPENGLLKNPKDSLIEILRKKFKNVRVTKAISHLHSSLGASKGPEKYPVTELIFWAK